MGLVAITGVKSRFVVTAGGLILVTLGLLPVLGRVVAAVPPPVLGGAGIVLFGSVAASGIRTLAKVDFGNGANLIIVATSLGFGMLPIAVPEIYANFPAWFETIFHSGISSAAVMAILLNILFNEFRAGNPPRGTGSVFANAPVRAVRYESIEHLQDHLQEGDTVRNGKLVDCDGNEVPVITAAGEIIDTRVCKPQDGSSGSSAH